ncbi:ferredoxin [Pedobacter suwonensis]|uniref:ferredoxin n=1 Tax=Pedobacter suwonensis TaxID=332999 RepID=UPI0011A24564|nr:ferredoxin [Pedobacter suwonensis]
MEFLKKIFSTKTKDKNMPLPERYPENSAGDFYVENEVCITCGAPEAEAPDLIEHSKNEYGHCYFKKQPTTVDELDRAINAMLVSCISSIRYCGKDKAILKRLYDLGMQAECDYKPEDLE